jgi:hypothetical protein
MCNEGALTQLCPEAEIDDRFRPLCNILRKMGYDMFLAEDDSLLRFEFC